MPHKLICSDIDGTLLNKDRELSTKTKEVISNLKPIPFILISSRMPQAMEHLQEEMDIQHLPLICYNGGLIIEGSTVLQSTEINIDITSSLADFSAKSQLHCSLYHHREWYVPALDYWAKRESNNTKVIPEVQASSITIENWKKEGKGAHKIMCMGEEKGIDALAQFIQDNFSEQIVGYRSKPTYLEISPKSISKKTAIETLLSDSFPETSLLDVTAFGDNYNDIEMLEAVGTGVAVENAIPEVLAVADVITRTNKEDGVALFLEGVLCA